MTAIYLDFVFGEFGTGTIIRNKIQREPIPDLTSAKEIEIHEIYE